MSRKTSTYARKRARQGLPSNARVPTDRDREQWAQTVISSRDYTHESNRADFDRIMANIRLQLERITSGAVPKDDVEPHDLLAHVIGITQIRLHDIGLTGTDSDKAQAGTAIDELNQATRAIKCMRERWQRTGTWGLDGPGIMLVRYAIDTYEEVLSVSTPRQMELAQARRLAQIKKAQQHNLEQVAL